MEFFRRSTNSTRPNNRITTEIWYSPHRLKGHRCRGGGSLRRRGPDACCTDAAQAEPKATVYRLCFLWGLPTIAEWTAAFDQGLAELGWLSGQNIIIEHRSADGHYDRLTALTAELIGLKANLIVALSAPETAAAKEVAGTSRSCSWFTAILPAPVTSRVWRTPAAISPVFRKCTPS